MLIDKGLSAGEVVSLKLTSGEEVVARLEEENITEYKISKPMVLSMGPQGVGMMPFMFTVDPEKTVAIEKTKVAVAAATFKEFADQYLSGTTGIKLG